MPRMMIEIDDRLLEEARRLSGARTKEAAIEAALREWCAGERAGSSPGRVDITLTRRDLRTMREGR